MRAFALACVLLAGCGASQTRTGHEVLNGITDVGDPTYALALETCDAARDAIIEREGTTYEEDRRAMDQIHEVCDGIVLGFESLRGVQVTAREALNTGQFGPTVQAGIREALVLWGQLQALVPQLASLGRE